MPTLLFADHDALRLTLARGVLPPDVIAAPVRSGVDDRRRVWVTPDAPLPRDVPAALERLGISVRGGDADIELAPAADWLHLLPLEPAPLPNTFHAPILLELPADRLPRLMAEIQRLAPQSHLTFRMADWWNAGNTVLVFVAEVPHFTLMRSGDNNLTAYYEQSPTVWVEVGYAHPFANRVRPSVETLTLIRAPDRWSQREVLPPSSELALFSLPASPLTLNDRADVGMLEMRLRLMKCAPTGAAELWIIRERPFEQIAELAEESGPEFLSRFRFAAVETQDGPIAVLWAKPSKGLTPIPTLAALSCRPFLQLPNLFLPCEFQLTPPPRRDIARLLAPEADSITILLPDAERRYVPLSVPISAFVSLDQWIEYESPALQSLDWQPRQTSWEWEPFEEMEISEPPSKPETRVAKAESRRRRPGIFSRLRSVFQPDSTSAREVPRRIRSRMADAVDRALPDAPLPAPVIGAGRKHNLNDRRTRLEAKFLQSTGAEDVAKRLVVLPELAGLNSQLGYHADAAACWLNAIWEHPVPPPYWFWGWLQAERKLARVLPGEDEWQQLLDAIPTPHTIRVLAATTVWLSRQPAGLGEWAGKLRSAVEAHEDWLPVRAVWLAHTALAHATGDLLVLARTRDRLHERLYHHGLNLERDVPAFLRFAGGEAAERFPAVRDWLDRVRDPIHRWADHLTRNRPTDYVPPMTMDFLDADGRITKSIIDLILAWGMARLGEQTAARLLAQGAAGFLRRSGDSVPSWIAGALEYRIAQALEGKSAGGSLPVELLAALEQLPADGADERRFLARFQIDMLRSHLRVLEPEWRGNAFRPRERMPDPENPAAFLAAAQRLLNENGNSTEAARLAEQALDQAAMLGAPHVHGILEAVDEIIGQVTEPVAATLLLEKLVTGSLSRGDGDAVVLWLPRIAKLFAPNAPRFSALTALIRMPLANVEPRGPDVLRRLEALPGMALRGLRRWGRSEAADLLQTPAIEWVLGGTELTALRAAFPQTWLSALRAVLHVAGNWFGGPHEDRAIIVLDVARTALFRNADMPAAERLALAQVYAAAVSRAHPRVAQGRVEELFRDLSGLYDTRQTNAHFALSPLALVDSVVRAAVSDDFTLGSAARRWLDDDEFRVRVRLRRDYENMEMLQ